jgi:hypothetical protein
MTMWTKMETTMQAKILPDAVDKDAAHNAD